MQPYSSDQKDYTKLSKTIKTMQLIIITIIDIAFFCVLSFCKPLRAAVFGNKYLFILCALTWAVLIIALIFILLDYHMIILASNDTFRLSQIAYSDALTGMPNRQSIDLMINLQDSGTVSQVGCILIKLTSLEKLNDTLGHAAGDRMIREFSQILNTVSTRYGFVGRNGGNDFLCIFENCNDELVNTFIGELTAQINSYNQNHEYTPIGIKYSYAINDEEGLPLIVDLLADVYRDISN